MTQLARSSVATAGDHGIKIVAAIKLFETVGMPARNLSERTRGEYSRDLAKFAEILGFVSIHRIGDVHAGHLGRYLARLEEMGLAPSSRRRKAYAVKSFFRFLEEHGELENSPAMRMRPPKEQRREPRYLTKDEYQRLLRACSHHPRDAAIIELFLQTGMRLSELAGLRISDVELPSRPSAEPDNVGLAKVTRKGGKVASIPLNYKACRALSAWLKIRPSVEHEAMFLTKYRTPLSKRAVQRLVTGYLAEARVEGASVHSLRHTMATHHVAAGTDLKTLQETLGHANLATTAMYVQLAKQAQRKALQANAL